MDQGITPTHLPARPTSQLRIEPLGQHDRAAFSCLSQGLTAYFTSQHVIQDVESGQARVFVLVDEATTEVLGYFTLSNSSIRREEVPQRFKNMYKEIPVTLLGRIAIHTRMKGSGLGDLLLAKALEKVVQAADLSASVGVILDPANEKVAAWYAKWGFDPVRALPQPAQNPKAAAPPAEDAAPEHIRPPRMYMKMAAIQKALNSALPQ